MKKLTIILNGGLRSCCSVYPPELVYEVMKGWTEGMCKVSVINVKNEGWHPDELASLAIKYFGEYAYPLIYIDDNLIAIGNIPNREELLAVLSKENIKGVTKEDIIEAAEEYGFVKGE